jgi:uncharacterized protein (DUF302 family)
MEPDGLTTWMSSFDQAETVSRLREAITDLGMTISAQIDHDVAAEAAGLKLRPTCVLLFGNAHAGTPLMVAAPTIAIDLPLKALVWTDEDGRTWLACNEPGWIAARHGVRTGVELQLGAMRRALATVADRATRRAPAPPP